MDNFSFRFPEFKPLPLRNWQASLPSAYAESLDLHEQMLQVLSFCNDIGLLTNQMQGNWNKLLAWIKTQGIDEAVTNQLNAWVLDGTMAKILDKTALKDINAKLDAMQTKEGQDIDATKAYAKELFDNATSAYTILYNNLSAKLDNDVATLNAKIGNMVDGSPKGTYKNLAALEAAYPKGASGVYITEDDGNWNYWDGNAWQKGGLYQAAGLPDYLISNTGAVVWSNGEASWDATNQNGDLYISNGVSIIGNNYADIDLSLILDAVRNSGGIATLDANNHIQGVFFMLIYDFYDKKVKLTKPSAELTEQQVMLFAHSYTSYNIGLLATYEIIKQNTKKISLSAMNVYAYVQNSKKISYNETSPTMELQIPDDVILRGTTVATIPKADIISAANNSNGVVKVNSDGSISGNTFALLYNTTDGTVSFKYNSSSPFTTDNVLLVVNHYASLKAGLLVDSLDQYRIRDLENKPDTPAASDGIPTYYQDHITAKIKEINQVMANVGSNSLSFLYIADTHWESNNGNSPALIKKVLNETCVPFIIHGGDLFDQENDKNTAVNYSLTTRSLLNPFKYDMPVTIGNHDDNSNFATADIASHMLPIQTLFNTVVPNGASPQLNQKLVDYPNSLAWTIDFSYSSPLQKNWWGYGFDTGSAGRGFKVNVAQLQGLIDLCKNEGNVIVFQHVIADNAAVPNFVVDIEKVIDAINAKAKVTTTAYGTYDCTGCKAHIPFALAGHDHKDELFKTPAGTPMIVVDCDAGKLTWNNTTHPYIQGTITEQSFNIVTVDPSANNIILTRIGRGDDQTIKYI